MARGKNATALFEVIHAAKRPPKASPSAGIPQPRWWAKGKKAEAVEQPAIEMPAQRTTESVGKQRSWLSAARQAQQQLVTVEPPVQAEAPVEPTPRRVARQRPAAAPVEPQRPAPVPPEARRPIAELPIAETAPVEVPITTAALAHSEPVHTEDSPARTGLVELRHVELPDHEEAADAAPVVVITRYYPADPLAEPDLDEPPDRAAKATPEPALDEPYDEVDRHEEPAHEEPAYEAPAEEPAAHVPPAYDPPEYAPPVYELPRFDAPAYEPAPAPVDEADEWDDDPEPPVARSIKVPKIARPAKRAVAAEADPTMAVDRAAREVKFRLSYGGLIAIAAIVATLLVIAYLAGSQRNDDAATDRPASKLPVKREAVSSLMAVSPAPAPAVDAAPPLPPLPPLQLPGDGENRPVATPVAPAAVTPAPVPAVSVPASARAPRQVGRQYVVVQSYSDADSAQKACEFLNRANVPCTVVQGLADFAFKDWYSVVGTQAFDGGRRSPGYKQYERTVYQLGTTFSRKVTSQFQPQLYTWRAESDQSPQ